MHGFLSKNIDGDFCASICHILQVQKLLVLSNIIRKLSFFESKQKNVIFSLLLKNLNKD